MVSYHFPDLAETHMCHKGFFGYIHQIFLATSTPKVQQFDLVHKRSSTNFVKVLSALVPYAHKDILVEDYLRITRMYEGLNFNIYGICKTLTDEVIEGINNLK